MTDFNEIKTDTTERMEKTLETLRNDFGGLRAGRAHASLLDNIMVEAYGTPTPIAQVGTVSVPDARTLSVSVWDKGIAKAVEKALRESDLGLNPVSDGQLIRIHLPFFFDAHSEIVGAQQGLVALHSHVHRLGDGHDHDHRADADDDAQHRENAAHLVGADAAQRQLNIVAHRGPPPFCRR